MKCFTGYASTPDKFGGQTAPAKLKAMVEQARVYSFDFPRMEKEV
jgi:hypothetical protein